MVVAPTLAPTEATRRWAALLRQIFEVDPLVCPRCVPARPASSPREATMTRREADRTKRDAGRRPTDRRGRHMGWWRGVKCRAILAHPRFKFLS